MISKIKEFNNKNLSNIILFIIGGIILQSIVTLFFSSDHSLEKITVVILWLFWAIVLINIYFIVKNNVKKIIFSYAFLILMVLFIEISLRIFSIFHIIELNRVDQRSKLSFYQDKAWAKQFFDEMNDIWGQSRYVPYVGWRKPEYSGDYINIDEQGIRKTYASYDSINIKNSNSLFMFGGSTMWGVGSRDDYTIPSYLAKQFYSEGYPFVITNYGESAYQFFQEIIYLIYLLNEGHRPDYVIFYDGINELWPTYKSGVPGRHHQTEIINQRIEKGRTTSVIKYFSYAVEQFYESTMISKAIKKMLFIYNSFNKDVEKNKFENEQTFKLANHTINRYYHSYQLLDKLSELYNFKYLCFWQPIISTEKNITNEEKSMSLAPDLARMYTIADSLTKENKLNNFYNISNVFNDKNETYYIDGGHLNELGNKIVSNKIYEIFKHRFLSEQ